MFPFITQSFVEQTLGDSAELISIESIGSETGIASTLAKIGVIVNGSKKFYVVKSFACLSMPSQGKTEKVDMVLRELSFYKQIAPLLSPKYINIPQLRGSCIQKQELSNEIQTFERIIIDYVGSPWVLGNQLEGLNIVQAKGVMKALARLHSFPLESLNAIPSWLSKTNSKESNGFLFSMTGFLRSTIFKVLPSLNNQNLSAEEEKRVNENIAFYVPDIPTTEVVAALEGLWKHWENLFVVLDNAPLRLIHHDARGENLFFKEREDGECEVCFVDWQNVSLGPEAFDIAYLLTGSLTISERRKYEHELIQVYFDEYVRFNNLQGTSCDTTLDEIITRYYIALVWPLLWATCTISGIEELLDSCGKVEPVSRERTKQFMITTTSRYLQAAIDHKAIEKIEKALSENR